MEWEERDLTPRRVLQTGPGQVPPGKPTPAGTEDCEHLGVLDCGEKVSLCTPGLHWSLVIHYSICVSSFLESLAWGFKCLKPCAAEA